MSTHTITALAVGALIGAFVTIVGLWLLLELRVWLRRRRGGDYGADA